MSDYKILLYYKYVNIDSPEDLRDSQLSICTKLNLKGRIIVAEEGINGTVEGTEESINKYCEILKNDPKFSDIHLKISEGNGNAFPKLSIKIRDEIVSTHLKGEDNVNPNETTGKYIRAEELHELLNSDEEFYIIDMRNDYEHVVGHFKDSILPAMRNFRDLPKIIEDIKHLRDKKVITVCTGGIRCEKASGYLIKHGFKDVSQLYGGIVTYMERYPNEDFLGELYVFDGRVIMGFNLNSDNHTIIGTCELCGETSNNYINCADDPCHRHFICCENCVNEHDGHVLCSKEHKTVTVTA